MNDFMTDSAEKIAYLEDLLLQFTELFDTADGEVVFVGDPDDAADLIETTLQTITTTSEEVDFE